MYTYLLILVALLLLLLLALVYFGHRQLNQLRLAVTKNSNNLNQVASMLDTVVNSHGVQDGGHHVSEHNVVDDMPVPKPVPGVGNAYVLQQAEDDSDDEDRFEQLDESDNEVEDNEHSLPFEGQELDIVPEVEEVEEVDEVQEDNETPLQVEEVIENQDISVDQPFESDNVDALIEETTKHIDVSSAKKAKKGRKRCSPNELPGEFELGFQLVSENDGKLYEVTANVKGHKRWKAVSTNKQVPSVSDVVQEDNNAVHEENDVVQEENGVQEENDVVQEESGLTQEGGNVVHEVDPFVNVQEDDQELSEIEENVDPDEVTEELEQSYADVEVVG